MFYRPARMTFGVFMAPFHRVGESPTLALERDLELIEHLDQLGLDEVWIGEHHSGGRELIGEPMLMIASDAYMLGIDPVTQRERMSQALDAIMALLRREEPLTMETDWFTLREARL